MANETGIIDGQGVVVQIRFTYYKSEILVPVVGILWASSSWILQLFWNNNLLQGFGPTAGVMLFLVLYDRWLWKIPLLRFMNTAPDLNGMYSGWVAYCYDGVDGTKKCILEIKQTCSIIKIKSIFNKDGENETQSVSMDAYITTDETQDQHLLFYYKNRGSCKAGDTLDQHDGMNVLEILKKGKSIRLKGYYFTNRNPQTKGCMEVVRINKGE